MGSEKRKLSDILGSQWNKEELSQFDRAYRKYGKNWRKVAGAIRSKSAGMVEGLYNINKAFLSLPEGQGTADAFLAMMTDHAFLAMMTDRYNILLSCIRRHPVGKRTPRIPVECFHDSNNKDVIVSPNQEVSRVKLSGSSNRGTYNTMVSHVLPSEKKNVGSDVANTNCMDVRMYVNYSSGSLGNREAGDKGSRSDSRQSNSEGYGRNEYKWNVKFQKERHTSTVCVFNQNMDAREVCSGFVEEGELFSLNNLHT